MYQFNITQNSTLPYLEMEVINDGLHDFNKIYYALEASDVTFTMIDYNTGIKKIANAKCNIVSFQNGGCVEKVKIQYQWNKRDTKDVGMYKGIFRIIFSDDIVMNGATFPKGELNVPIAEELIINIL